MIPYYIYKIFNNYTIRKIVIDEMYQTIYIAKSICSVIIDKNSGKCKYLHKQYKCTVIIFNTYITIKLLFSHTKNK